METSSSSFKRFVNSTTFGDVCFISASQLVKKNDKKSDGPQKELFLRSKRLHFDVQDCEKFSNTEEGALSLRNPPCVNKGTRDLNRGLIPKQARKDRPALPFCISHDPLTGQGIQAAKNDLSLHNKKKNPGSTVKRRTRKNVSHQKNKVTTYFQPSKNSTRSSCATMAKSSNSMIPLNSTPPRNTSIFNTTSQKKYSPSSMYAKIERVEGTSNIFQCISPEKVNVLKDLFDAGKKCSAEKRRNSSTDSNCDQRNKSARLHSTPPSHTDLECGRSIIDQYGLLGVDDTFEDSDKDCEPECHFSRLPLEIIENIFCHLSLIDLLLGVSCVCVTWQQIISNPKFAFWKKRYYKLQVKRTETTDEMSTILNDNNMQKTSDFLPGLIRYMTTYKRVSSQNMLKCLENHSKFDWALELLKERMPDCIIAGVPNPWSVIAVIVVLSEFVSDIELLMQHLLSTSSQCTSLEVSEAFYCMACFLLVFKRKVYQDVWTGMHYRVMYALYLFENASGAKTSQLENVYKVTGQQTMLKYGSSNGSIQLTHEQFRICNHDIKSGQTLKIVAFAGTGKTATLVRYTQLRPSWKFLLVVYNRSVREHADKRFPGNVTCKTGHQLAHRKIGFRYGAIKGKLGNLKVGQVADCVQHRKGESLYVQAKLVIDTIGKYVSSADEEISIDHVPTHHMQEDGLIKPIEEHKRRSMTGDALRIWRMMCNVKEMRVPMTFDGYLKLYQLSNPVLGSYNVILIDEAQDLTPAITDIILKQNTAKILVGDPHQQIYSFRGAVNAMKMVESTHTFYLTQSFRFGPEIAFVASSCLELWKREKKMLVGNGKKGSIRGDTVGQIAVICRCNFTLFQEAVKKCCLSDDPCKVAFAGGIDAFGFDMILDIYTLILPEEQRVKDKLVIKNAFIKKFEKEGIGALESYAKKTMDAELMGKLKIVRTYNNDLPSLIRKIRSKCTSIMDTADTVFSTAHKSKGLEFDTVRVTDDYTSDSLYTLAMSPNQEQPNLEKVSDEVNLLYVAVTRAKKRLILTPTLITMLSSAGEKFRYPVCSQILQKEAVPMKCALTDAEFKPTAISLVKREVQLVGGFVAVNKGVICPQVVTEEISSLSKLYGSLPDKSKNSQK